MRLFRFRSENLWRESSRRILLERLGDRLIFRFHLEYIRISTFFISKFASLFLDNNNLTYHDARFKLSLNSLIFFQKPTISRKRSDEEGGKERKTPCPSNHYQNHNPYRSRMSQRQSYAADEKFGSPNSSRRIEINRLIGLSR